MPPPPPVRPPPPPATPPPPAPPPPWGGWPPSVLVSREMVLSSCVIVKVTLSAFCIRGLRFWLFALSRTQVPAKVAFWALAATTSNKNAVASPAIRNILFILKILRKFWSLLVARARFSCEIRNLRRAKAAQGYDISGEN